MLRCLLCGAIAALALAPAALADGPAVGATEGWTGVASPKTGLRFVTITGNRHTTLEAIGMRGGTVFWYMSFPGIWGIPTVTYHGTTGGLSADGRTLVLEDGFGRSATLRVTSSFLIFDTKRVRSERTVRLRGDFLFDALSPGGQTIYLIQHISANDLTRYVVRAFDVSTGRLLPGAIADRTQRGWVMQGYPLMRATSADGRWVYTLYENDGGTPFVHALDTVRGAAHCVGIPWHGSQNGLWNIRLSVPRDGQRLLLNWTSGKRLLAVDTQTFRIAYPGRAHRFPWWIAGLGAGIALVLLALGLLRVRMRVRNTPTSIHARAEAA